MGWKRIGCLSCLGLCCDAGYKRTFYVLQYTNRRAKPPELVNGNLYCVQIIKFNLYIYLTTYSLFTFVSIHYLFICITNQATNIHPKAAFFHYLTELSLIQFRRFKESSSKLKVAAKFCVFLSAKPLLSWNFNNAFPLHCYWLTCICHEKWCRQLTYM